MALATTLLPQPRNIHRPKQHEAARAALSSMNHEASQSSIQQNQAALSSIKQNEAE